MHVCTGAEVVFSAGHVKSACISLRQSINLDLKKDAAWMFVKCRFFCCTYKVNMLAHLEFLIYPFVYGMW